MSHLAYTGGYPANWEEMRWQVYERAGWRCEHCGMEFEPGTTRACNAERSRYWRWRLRSIGALVMISP